MLSTPESQAPSRNLIWSARWSLSDPNSLITKSYETSVRELIGSDPVLRPFFDTAWTSQYERSWLPTETGSPDLALSSSSSSLMKQAEGSWFRAREYRENPTTTPVTSSNPGPISGRTCYPSFMFSPAATTERESTGTQGARGVRGEEEGGGEQPPRKKRRKKSEIAQEKGFLIRSRKIRISPTEEQGSILKRCIGIHRHIYNECVTSEKNGLVHGASAQECSRWKTILTKQGNYRVLKPWKDQCPSHPKQQAVETFFEAKRAAISNVSAGNQARFQMGYKNRFKMRQETIPFERYRFADERTYLSPGSKKYTGGEAYIGIPYQNKEMRLRIKGKVPAILRGRVDQKSVRKEIKIIRTRLGEYFAVVSVETPQTSLYQNDPTGDMVSFDPGSKTFLTWHSNDGTWGEIGKFDPQEALLRKADRLKSDLDGLGKTKSCSWRRRMRRRFLATLEKVRNRTEDLHNKVCSWVTKRFRVIILPSFDTSQMVSSSSRLSSTTCRKMMTWSHYRFRQKLISVAQKFKEVKVRISNESFTTKTCGRCGKIWEKMTLNDRIFKCENCGLVSGRDCHAARNIGLRAFPYLLS